ncbi:MAG: hypothetical protein ACLQU1_08545 [Bryobacteraceae bacterium]
MPERECEVLRDIQLGNVGLEEAFEVSGISPYAVRRHLLVCAACAASMDEVRVQLRHFDRARLAEIDQDLRSKLDEALHWAESSARGWAEDIAEGMSVGESFVEDASAGFVSQNRERVQLEIIRLHSDIGKRVEGWFETFLPPDLAGNWLQTLSLAPDLVRLLCSTNQEAAKVLLRALLLREAFGCLTEDIADAVAPKMNSGELFGGDLSSPIAWKTVWRHYSALAGLSIGRLSESLVGITEPRSAPRPEGFDKLLQRVEEISQRTDEIWQGQTAMMERIDEIEKAERQLLTAYDNAPDRIKESCQKTLRAALGSLYDDLATRTCAFLLAAELGYAQLPAEIDFSTVMVGYSKAFECEFRRAIAPLRSCVEAVSTNAGIKGDFDRYTLGAFKKLLESGRGSLEAPFREHGLAYDDVLKAVTRVNREAEAKHLAAKNKSEATTFRSLFLGTPSIFAFLVSTGGEST